MKPKTLGLLIVILIVLIAAVSLRHAGRSTGPAEGGRDAGERVLAGLDINAIEKMNVEFGDASVTLQRTGDRWVVSSLYDYPAAFVELAEIIRSLGEMDIGQVMHDGEKFPADYGLAAGGSDTNLPGHVRFFDGEGHLLAHLLLGSLRERETEGPYGSMPDGRYVRAEGGPVVLVDQTLDAVSADPADWVEKELLNINGAELKTVEVTVSNETYTVTNNDGEYLLEPLAEEEGVDQTAAGRLMRALQYFNMSSVVDPSTADAELGFDQPGRYVAHGKDGMILTLTTARPPEGDERYVRIRVEARAQPAPTRESVAEEGLEESDEIDADYQKALEAHREAQEALEKKANRLKRDLAGWTYRIGNYTWETLQMPRSELVEVIEVEDEADSTSAESE